MPLISEDFKIKYGYIVQTIALIFLIILFYFMYTNVTFLKTDPCGACAKRLGQSVICTTTGIIRTYDTNGNYTDSITIVRTNIMRIDDINYTEFAENIEKQQRMIENLTGNETNKDKTLPWLRDFKTDVPRYAPKLHNLT